jgi:hypothetical protein
MIKKPAPGDSGTYSFTPAPGYAPDVVILDPDDIPTAVWVRVDMRDAYADANDPSESGTRKMPAQTQSTAKRERRLADRRSR